MATKIVVQTEHAQPRTTMAATIAIGQFFLGKVGIHSGLFVRHYSGIMLMADPSKTWAPLTKLEVFNYVPVDAVTITVGLNE